MRTDRSRPRVGTGRLGLLAALAGVVVTAYAEPAGASHMARFERGEYRVAEDARSASVLVLRDDPKGALKVDYATADGTATAGSDYVAAAGTLEFSDGQREASFVVTVTDDGLAEDDESVLLILRTDGGRPDGIDGGLVPHETGAVLSIIGNDGGVAGTPPPGAGSQQDAGDSGPSDPGQAGTAGLRGTPPADGRKTPSGPSSTTGPGAGAALGEDGADEEGVAPTAPGNEQGAVVATDQGGRDTSGGGSGNAALAALAGLALVTSAGGGLWWRRSRGYGAGRS